MIFVNTANKAEKLAEILKSKNVNCIQFHKNIHDDIKAQNLEDFRNEKCSIMICTDSAARGLDLPNVKHVIQAEFALNVVQHLHRIGRASRGGVSGYATNFYDKSALHLVSTMLPKETDSRTVEQAFSRRRGLRQKSKKQERRNNTDNSNNNINNNY